ncbi:Uncharacterized protein FWK35_00037259, partial [Aphis craccivora]
MEFYKPAPLKMTGNLPQNFKFFKQQIEIYITATETDTKSKGVQVARLLNLMGADALKVYNTLITDKDKDTEVSGILEKLEKYCSPRVNEIMAHYKFFTAKQNEDPFDVYLTHLKELVKPCNFGTMETKLLKTQIVLGEVVDISKSPRSYFVKLENEGRVLRRNVIHIKKRKSLLYEGNITVNKKK